jgi:hypothetical protein
MNSKVCLSANKDITWVMGSVAMNHLVKEDTRVINKYKLSAPTKIHIAKNNTYLLAYEKGYVVGETYVNGEVRNIRIPDIFLVKDLSYNLLSVSKLEKKGSVITIKNGEAQITKNRADNWKLQMEKEICINSV